MNSASVMARVPRARFRNNRRNRQNYPALSRPNLADRSNGRRPNLPEPAKQAAFSGPDSLLTSFAELV
jgi:hypothetical protein